MKTCISALALTFILVQSLSAQDYPMKANEEHALLKHLEGTWEAKMNMWMEGLDKDPTSSIGVEKITMLGDFWAITDLTYDYFGTETHGHGVMGYDPSIKKYVGSWHESGSPYVSQMSGTYDEESGNLTYLMKSKDPQGNEMDLKIIMHQIDDDSRTFEMQMKAPGSDDFVKFMLIEYTKK